MTKIEDMSEPQRQAWVTLLADGAVLAYFWQKMTAGFSIRPIDYDMADFGAIILGVVIVTIITHAVIGGIFEARKRKDAFEKDERDIEIEQRGAHWGYRVLQFGVGFVIVMMLLHHLIGEGYNPPVDVNTPVQIIFFLMVFSYAADLIKQGVMILAYRS